MRVLKCASLAAIAFTLALTALPTRAEEANAEALKIARSILEVNHSSATADQIITQIMKLITGIMNQANPGKADEINALLNQVVVPEFRAGLPDLLDQSAQTYANNFTVPELKQILAFYQSDIGKKLVIKQPEILREQSLVGQAYGQQVMSRVQQKLLKAIQERGLQTPKGL